MSSLTDDQLTAWTRDGWLHLPAVLGRSALISLDLWVEEIETRSGRHIGTHRFHSTGHKQLSRFVRSGIIVDVMADLFGEEAVLLLERIDYKDPGAGGRAPHQDASVYPFPSHHISCMVPLDNSTQESGCHHFASKPGDEPLQSTDGCIDPSWAAEAEWTPVECKPGDLVFFDSMTPHSSGANQSSLRRRAMYLTYNGASAGDLRAAKGIDADALDAISGDLVG